MECGLRVPHLVLRGDYLLHHCAQPLAQIDNCHMAENESNKEFLHIEYYLESRYKKIKKRDMKELLINYSILYYGPYW